MRPKLPGTSVKRWPFRKAPTIIGLLATTLVLLVAIEWSLLQSTQKSIELTTDEVSDKRIAGQLKNAEKQPRGHSATSSGKKGSLPPSPSPKPVHSSLASKDSLASTKKYPQEENGSYQVDELCGGCRSLKMEHLMRGIHQERCGILINRVAKQASPRLSDLEAAKLVNQNYTDCRSCLECEPHQKRYWRYDRVRPEASNARTHYLSSIPEEKHRIPKAVLNNPGQNMTEYFKSLNAKGELPKQYLFEYNPSIVALPEHITFPDQIQKEKPIYLASFRVATTQGCFPVEAMLEMIGGEWISDRIPEKKDYLGLALLREDLSIVEEAVVDLPRPFRKREDFRLFVIYNQLFISTYCKLTPMWIFHKDDESKYNETKFHGDIVDNWRVRDVFPSSLRVRIGAHVTQCAKERNDNKHAKNLNFFVNKNGETMVELYPLAPHVVRPLKQVLNAYAPVPGREDDISSEEMPSPSFFTVEETLLAREYEFFEVPFTADRGGACCIEIHDPRQPSKSLWLGISHSKTPHSRKKVTDRLKSNQYLSRWYAFEQLDPYKIVAVSGYFCLSSLPGDASHTDDALKANPLLSHAAATTSWTLGSLVMDCPVIHFVTGMTEKINDNSKLILGYGIGDCASMFIEVAKAEVLHLLFDGPNL